MKKFRIVSVLLLAMFILSSLNLAVFADFSEGIGQIIVNNSTPTIDAEITADEGWPAATNFNVNNMKNQWGSIPDAFIVTGDARMAWDTDGIYIAADITDANMVVTTDEDDDDTDHGWDGDVFVFAIDPQNRCFEERGMVTNDDYTAWYCVSINEDNELVCFVSHNNAPGDITDDIQGAAKLTDKGWAFEIMIPWDTISDDLENVTSGKLDADPDEVAVPGYISNCMFMYLDRAVASESLAHLMEKEYENGEIFTIARGMSAPTIHRDSLDFNTAQTAIRSYGIEAAFADENGVFTPVATNTDEPDDTSDAADTSAPEDVVTEDDTTAPEENVTDEAPAADPEVDANEEETENDEPPAPVEVEDEGGSSTVIIIVVVSVVVVAAAAVAVILVLKKKKA